MPMKASNKCKHKHTHIRIDWKEIPKQNVLVMSGRVFEGGGCWLV